MAYAVDPDKQGALVWQYRTSAGQRPRRTVGRGRDGRQAYFGVNGTLSPAPGGMRAVKLDTGEEVWSKPAAEKLCGTDARLQRRAGLRRSPPIPGIVFSARWTAACAPTPATTAPSSGSSTPTASSTTVNGVKANGAAMDGPGAVVVDGMMYVNSGYVRIVGRPGNVLLAFGVD